MESFLKRASGGRGAPMLDGLLPRVMAQRCQVLGVSTLSPSLHPSLPLDNRYPWSVHSVPGPMKGTEKNNNNSLITSKTFIDLNSCWGTARISSWDPQKYPERQKLLTVLRCTPEEKPGSPPGGQTPGPPHP